MQDTHVVNAKGGGDGWMLNTNYKSLFHVSVDAYLISLTVDRKREERVKVYKENCNILLHNVKLLLPNISFYN